VRLRLDSKRLIILPASNNVQFRRVVATSRTALTIKRACSRIWLTTKRSRMLCGIRVWLLSRSLRSRGAHKTTINYLAFYLSAL
jgi:hypothetical protein